MKAGNSMKNATVKGASATANATKSGARRWDQGSAVVYLMQLSRRACNDKRVTLARHERSNRGCLPFLLQWRREQDAFTACWSAYIMWRILPCVAV